MAQDTDITPGFDINLLPISFCSTNHFLSLFIYFLNQ